MTTEAAIPTHHTDTYDTAWDGPAAIAAIPDDATAADLRAVFAWVDSAGDPEAKASYKFPHHSPDGSASLIAASAGIAALNGGRGGADIPASDRQGVYNHLAAHLKDGGAEDVAPLEAGGDPMGVLRGHLEAALKVIDMMSSDTGGDMGGNTPPAPGDGKPTPPGEAFDPKSKEALESLAAAMIADPDWALEVQKVAASLSPREVEGDFVPLLERAVADDGTAQLRVIVPGWGSSGYYSPAVLERDGPKAFPSGTKMFWNHQTEAEEDARPEGDLRDLAGELTEDATFQADGAEGPGLYAKAKVFSAFAPVVEELAPHIGVSIRAMGKASSGEAEGREGTIIDALTQGLSVDYVTAPGAGGKVLSLFESVGRKGEVMDDTKLQEAQDDARKAREALATRDAADIVRDALAEARLPDAAAKRLSEALPAKVKLNDDGELDREDFEGEVAEAIKSEVAYLSEVTGAGNIQGMGSVEDEGKAAEELEGAFRDMGLSDQAAKEAATGRS